MRRAIGSRRGFARAVLCAGVVVGAMVAGLIAPCAPAADVPARTPAVGLDLTGPIGPATSDYVARGLARAAAEGAPLAIVRLDTPGGLETSMREIVQAILAARMPVVGFVGPAGAHAASAGTFILYACHVAAMAPATNLGAATPVAVPTPGLPGAGGGDKQDDGPAGTPPDLRDKAISDAVAFIRSLAQLRGRNAEWAELAVTRAASLSADDALREGVIDLIAADVADLMARLDGRTVALVGGSVRLETAGLAVSVIEPDWRSRLLAAITDPTVAAILMLIGVYGLIFEFYSPGLVGPGVIGAICLLLALYAFHVLPVNESALALMVLGLALTVAEAVTPGFGVLGLGGLVAFVLGAVMLVDRDIPGFAVAWQAVGGAALMVGGLGLAALWLAMRARRRPVVSGREEMTGQAGTVVRWEGRSGVVHVHGERWAARAARPLQPGEQVRVAAIDGLTLEVEPQPQQQPDEQPARQKERRSAKDDQTEERREP